MREYMLDAAVGDDVFGEDPTVNRLQEVTATLLGKEAALFVPSGCMGNEICIRVLTNPGDELICDAESHIINYEAGAMAMLSDVQHRPVYQTNGILTADAIKELIRPSTYYFPSSRLIALENTHNMAGGIVTPLPVIEEIAKLARDHQLKTHLDGARLWHASTASGVSVAEYARHFDSVMVCFSKALGAPVGSAIAGTTSFIDEARRVRKQFGGAMRQAGILAAACLFGLDNNREKLETDHENAFHLADMISGARNIELDMQMVQTNIVIFSYKGNQTSDEACQHLQNRGVQLIPVGEKRVRAVTHLDVSKKDIEAAATMIINEFDQE